ncbi:RNA pyrophosphohydrolase [Sphingomicrobium marinum]|uniref:RNA pyrophosphohydrolase n=1 Tax=Sphingomicrobium marinum TaxID=1227950 RepID=UPI002240C08D|nr:RNA pyrophosphohydrolase [Sphingomicrobium marinum]
MNDDDKYRLGAGVMLLNEQRHVWVGRRIDNTDEAWQMPQGGVDPGEDSFETALRELEEETGIAREYVERIEDAPVLELKYDLPDSLKGTLWGGKWVGQRQHWFLMQFTGDDSQINIETEDPEFSHWKWIESEHLPDIIVPFKRDMYRAILDGFSRWL